MSEMRHWPTLIFEDEFGDLCRCDCGDQGFDFAAGRDWFLQHVKDVANHLTGPTGPVGPSERPGVSDACDHDGIEDASDCPDAPVQPVRLCPETGRPVTSCTAHLQCP